MQALTGGSAQEAAKRTDFSGEAELYPEEAYQAYFNTDMLSKDYIVALDNFLASEWKRVQGHPAENSICEYARYLKFLAAQKADRGYAPSFRSLHH